MLGDTSYTEILKIELASWCVFNFIVYLNDKNCLTFG